MPDEIRREALAVALRVYPERHHVHMRRAYADAYERGYRAATALVRKHIPRDHASHEGHRIQEIRTYGSPRARAACIDCRVSLDDYEEG
ncbi:hypothetical protein J2Y69_002118 [Microbacterium resistens]|uniref:HEPN domain-containing protein n=2 Tax=Microbacterium resistens TaxID=156977 RepID=A0ABU1SD65_9MICO|nr:hypothetical protein [Microbacterium resistens]